MTTTTFCSAFIRVLHHFEARHVRGLYLAQQPGQATQPGQVEQVDPTEQAGTSSLAPVAQSQNVRCEPARLGIVALLQLRIVQRRALAALSDALLEDIGLTRAQVQHECAKWPWQE